jgi:hypothetical protein
MRDNALKTLRECKKLEAEYMKIATSCGGQGPSGTNHEDWLKTLYFRLYKAHVKKKSLKKKTQTRNDSYESDEGESMLNEDDGSDEEDEDNANGEREENNGDDEEEEVECHDDENDDDDSDDEDDGRYDEDIALFGIANICPALWSWLLFGSYAVHAKWRTDKLIALMADAPTGRDALVSRAQMRSQATLRRDHERNAGMIGTCEEGHRGISMSQQIDLAKLEQFRRRADTADFIASMQFFKEQKSSLLSKITTNQTLMGQSFLTDKQKQELYQSILDTQLQIEELDAQSAALFKDRNERGRASSIASSSSSSSSSSSPMISSAPPQSHMKSSSLSVTNKNALHENKSSSKRPMKELTNSKPNCKRPNTESPDTQRSMWTHANIEVTFYHFIDYMFQFVIVYFCCVYIYITRQ